MTCGSGMWAGSRWPILLPMASCEITRGTQPAAGLVWRIQEGDPLEGRYNRRLGCTVCSPSHVVSGSPCVIYRSIVVLLMRWLRTPRMSIYSKRMEWKEPVSLIPGPEDWHSITSTLSGVALVKVATETTGFKEWGHRPCLLMGGMSETLWPLSVCCLDILAYIHLFSFLYPTPFTRMQTL